MPGSSYALLESTSIRFDNFLESLKPPYPHGSPLLPKEEDPPPSPANALEEASSHETSLQSPPLPFHGDGVSSGRAPCLQELRQKAHTELARLQPWDEWRLRGKTYCSLNLILIQCVYEPNI